jgi:NDP-4-keto-2,6-dideoxyhexose 3-C-methyltransferase
MAPKEQPMNPSYTTRTTCRACGSSDLAQLFSLGDQYVSDFVPKARVHSGNRVPIDVDLCRGCSLVQARHTAPQDFLYSRHYWYRSGVTDTMRRALADVVDAAMSRVSSINPGDIVLDIGSNDGTLLRQYPRELFAVTVGVEPATNLADEGRRGITHLINDFWSYEAWARAMDVPATLQRGPTRVAAKIVTACGMFYDLEDPNQFIADVAKVLHPDGVFVAQLMCLKQTLERRDVGNFAHEHLEFYSLASLDILFARHGLGIVDIEENDVNGGSYRIFARHAGREQPSARASTLYAAEQMMGLNRPTTYEAFDSRMQMMRDQVHTFISSERARGKLVYAYGASTKGNVILQYCGIDDRLVPYAADRSPEKWGKFTAGTGIEIVSEAAARAMCPDYFLVLPYAFLPEFLEREKDQEWRRRGGKFIVPLPEFKVV